MIRVENLVVRKDGRTICSVANLSVGAHERVAVVGPNGSGKSTLLRVLGGFETDYRGYCDVRASPGSRVLVHQNPVLFRGSVLSNITYGLKARGVRRSERLSLAMEWLERLEIAHLAQRSGAHLSGGERRRAALARAFVLRPHLLLLDEPLAELDQAGAAAVAGALKELSNTVVVLTSPVHAPIPLADRTCRVSANAGRAERASE